MTDQRPITPPPQLIDQWLANAPNPLDRLGYLATQAARWGADQELEACCEYLYDNELCDPNFHKDLLSFRRPKPPSLKEQASESLDKVVECLKILVPGASVDGVYIETLRRALETLDD